MERKTGWTFFYTEHRKDCELLYLSDNKCVKMVDSKIYYSFKGE